MGLVERLNELGSMRQNGQISDAEYALLVESATKNFGKENEVANSAASVSDSGYSSDFIQPKSVSRVSKIVGLVAIAAFIIFILGISRGGSSTETPTETVSEETSLSSSAWDATKEKREFAAKACRDLGRYREGSIQLLISRNSRLDTSEVKSGFVIVDYELAGTLSKAKEWITAENKAITLYRNGVVSIDRPELSNEKNSLISDLERVMERQIYLLGAQSWNQFNNLVTDYNLALMNFDKNQDLQDALKAICKG
jgi:hypothetical protein